MDADRSSGRVDEVGGVTDVRDLELICFYNEKVDIEVDGELLERPNTQFS